MKKLFVLMFVMILLVGTVSAFEFDNVKRYDEDTKTITVRNSFLGIPTTKVADIRLDSPLNNFVGAGYQKVAEFTITNFDDYTDPLKQLELYHAISGDSIQRTIDYKYRTTETIRVNDYKRNCRTDINGTSYCTSEIIGSHQETKTVWKDLDRSVLSKDEVITIGLFTDVQIGDRVEWIPTYYGVEIREWAIWTQSLNTELKGYWNFNEGTGTVAADDTENGNDLNGTNTPGWTTNGLISNATNLTRVNDEYWTNISSSDFYPPFGQAFTVNLWYKPTNVSEFQTLMAKGSSPSADFSRYILRARGDTQLIQFRMVDITSTEQAITSTTLMTSGNWLMITGVYDGGTNMSLWINGTFEGEQSITSFLDVGEQPFRIGRVSRPSPTTPNPVDGAIDEASFWNRSLSQNEIVQVFNLGFGITHTTNFGPDVTLNSPIDNFNTTNTTIEFNASVVDITGNDIVNVSLVLDGIVNETNSSGINNSDYFFTKIVSFDTHNWSYEACNNESRCFIPTVRNFEVSTFIENNITFNATPRETSSQFFEINISTIPAILSVSASLNYNGTQFVSDTSCVGLDCSITNTIDIPLVTEGQFEDKSFFWEISVFDGTSSVSVNSSTSEQNVTRINLEECGVFTTQALNFTAFDEQNLTRIDPFLFNGNFDQWIGGGTVKRQSNFTNSSIDEVTLCISPDDENYFIDATIEYDEAENTTDIYTLRNYYFQNDTINSTSQDVQLFLLRSSSATSFILKVQDDSLLPVPGVLIEINRFYPGTNEFRVVQIAKADDLGKSVGFFETEIVDYKFFITRNNSILLETGLQKVIPETSPFTLTFNIGEPLGEPWKTQDVITNLLSNLTFNESSLIVTYVYIDTSNDLGLARLFVIRESLTNASANIILCNENSTLSSATLTCNVSTTTGFYTASSFITRFDIEELDLQITFSIETLSNIVGLLGLFFGWFLILIASFMFRFNVVAGIWSITSTVFLINLMGFISFGSVFVTAVVGTAIILTWIMER